MSGSVYDIAVNVGTTADNIFYLEKDAALPDMVWSEGWHSGAPLSYGNLGVHSTDFTQLSKAAVTTSIEQELASANHISVFAVGYDQTGGHLVHYQGGTSDGAVVIDPLSASSKLMLFHFSNQSF